MKYRELGATGINVSEICLGTMTWGHQNDEADGHAQLDRAVDHGVNFIDNAEMYPVPSRPDTWGDTERILGTWLNKRGRRDDLIIATKAAGPPPIAPHIRDGKARHDWPNLAEAIEGSLERLQTNYIDLYQLHWPDRKTNMFGRLGYEPVEESDPPHIEETLTALQRLIEAGKIRYVGLSNETPWGILSFLRVSAEMGLPRVVSVQNPYSLLNRTFEVGNAEAAWREKVSLLAYSPLAFGVLTGKYDGDSKPAGSRLALYDVMKRYSSEHGTEAAARYNALARDHGLEPAQMAIAFTLTRPYLASSIIGATTLEQLEMDLSAAEIELSAEVMEGIEAIHAVQSNPCP